MKKAIVSILSAAMLATLISGCGGSTTAAPQSAQSESDKTTESDKTAEAEAAEGTAAEESSETDKVELKPYYVRIRETQRNAVGSLVHEDRYDEKSNLLWNISSVYSDPYNPYYSVSVYDRKFNDAGDVTEEKYYYADSIDSLEGFNPDDYKTDDYLQDTTTYTYDENGKVLSIESASYQMVYEYDANGNCTKRTETRSFGDTTYTETTTSTYDENSRVISETYENDNGTYTTEATYNDQGLLIKSVTTNADNPEDVTVYENTYDEQGRVIKSVSSGLETYSNYVQEYTYDSEGHASYKRINYDDEGNELITEYNADNIPIQGYEYNNGTLVTFASEIQYDDKGNLASITYKYSDGTSATCTNEFDENGNRIRETVTNSDGVDRYEEGSVTEYEYALVTPEQK